MMPAAWPMSTCTPARVTNRRSSRPNDTARACASVTSSRPRSLSQPSATFTRSGRNRRGTPSLDT